MGATNGLRHPPFDSIDPIGVNRRADEDRVVRRRGQRDFGAFLGVRLSRRLPVQAVSRPRVGVPY